MAEIFTAENLIALLTLTTLEIVLGIDNIVFIAILANKLPKEQQNKARQLGLVGAMLMRILLLLMIGWVVKLTNEWLHADFLAPILGEHKDGTPKTGLSWKDIILLVGGLFLIAKATHEIHNKLEGPGDGATSGKRPMVNSMTSVVIQIMLMDIIFSIDSVITAVGMARALWVMVTAVVIAIGVMMVFARPISDFVERHPTVKMLALSFLLLIGVMLVAEGFGRHIEKGYIYFAMAFSLFVEVLNIRLRGVQRKVHLHHSHLPEE